jgi:hypothetical protein
MERFCDESVEQWFSDLAWAWNDEKVRTLLQDVFYRRLRLSHIQARLWKRTVDLFWRAGWSLRQIGDQFGVDRRNVWRIVASLRREAQRFFGTNQSGQEVHPYEGQQPQPKKPKPAPIQPDPKNDSPEYWEVVLASHGLSDPDRPVYKGDRQWKEPIYKFGWRSGTSVHAESWAEFYESFQVKSRPSFRIQRKTAQAKRIGTKTVEIHGTNFEVGMFSPGVGNLRLARRRPQACSYRWWPTPQKRETNGFVEYGKKTA